MNRLTPRTSMAAAALVVGFLWSTQDANADWGRRRSSGYYYSSGYSSYGGCAPVRIAPSYCGTRSYYSSGYSSGFGGGYARHGYYSRGSYCAPPVRSSGFGFSFGYSRGSYGGYRHHGYNRNFGHRRHHRSSWR
ncbi:MAG: hypothetical protein AMXMBFR20_02980 [Planctomycetia bacterium]